MNQRAWALAVVCGAAAAVLGGLRGAEAPKAPESPRAQPVAENAVQRPWEQRLVSLTPDVPEAYFNLAEEVFDTDRTAEGQKLAKRLFVLTFELDRARGGSQSLAASACLALADISGNRSEREWLRALALQVDPRRELPVWVRRKPPATSEAIDYQVAVAVGLTRTGDGAFARQLLRRPEVRDRLNELERMARRMGFAAGADTLLREASRWPCPSCQNTRYEKRASSLLGEARLCSNCKGKPGARLSRTDYIAQLRFESWLLAGTKRTWASQVTVDMGEPLADLDPGALSRMMSVDATRPWYRDGMWVQSATGDVAPTPDNAPSGPKPATNSSGGS